MSAVKQLTIVQVPRERYGATERSLESIVRHSGEVPYKLLILDADSPPAVAAYLRTRAASLEDTELLRFDFAMTPNELRNEAIQRLDTPYVVFVDNDAIVTAGWLAPLLRAAREHDAWVVGPTMLIGEPETGRIHLAGGDCEIVEREGSRRYSYLQQHFCGRTLSEVGNELRKGPCTCIEFHCMLVAKQAFDRLGLLDEGCMSFVECDAFCLDVVAAGGTIYFEPESVVTYVPPRESLAGADLAYFLLRWSDDWNERSLATFLAKYDLDPADSWADHARSWPKQHRRHALRFVAPPFGRFCELVQYKVSRRLGDRLANALEDRSTREVRARRAAGLAARRAPH